MMLKSSVEVITSIDGSLVQPISTGNPNPNSLNCFSPEEIKTIKEKIKAYKNDPKVRVGGSQLLKELDLAHSAKQSYLKHITTIKEIITPAPREKVSIADAEKRALEQSVKNVAATFELFVKSNPKLLRTLAEAQLGDTQLEYTDEELPVVIATKQVLGVVLEPGKVL